MQEISGLISKEIPGGINGGTSGGISKGIPGNKILDESLTESLKVSRKKNPQIIQGKIAFGIAGKMLDIFLKNPGGKIGEILGRLSEGFPRGVLDGHPGDIFKEISGEIPEGSPTEMLKGREKIQEKSLMQSRK